MIFSHQTSLLKVVVLSCKTKINNIALPKVIIQQVMTFAKFLYDFLSKFWWFK